MHEKFDFPKAGMPNRNLLSIVRHSRHNLIYQQRTEFKSAAKWHIRGFATKNAWRGFVNVNPVLRIDFKSPVPPVGFASTLMQNFMIIPAKNITSFGLIVFHRTSSTSPPPRNPCACCGLFYANGPDGAASTRFVECDTPCHEIRHDYLYSFLI